MRARSGVANRSKKIRRARLSWLGQVARKTEEDVVMRTWKWMEVCGHRNIGRLKLRESEVIRKDMRDKKIEKAQDRKTWRLKTRCADPRSRRSCVSVILVVGLSLFLFFPLSGMRCCLQLASLFHPTLSPVFFFQSPSSPAFFTSLLTQSSHLSLGLPRLLLPCSHNSAALFGSLSSAILSTCPVLCNLLLTSLAVKLLFTPVSSLNSAILRLSALVTLAIFRTQLFSHTCGLCCSSVRAKVSFPFRHAGVTQVLMTLPFSLFEIRRSAITPSNALHAFAPACTLRRTILLSCPYCL